MSDALDVLDQQVGGVLARFAERRGSAGTPLVEQHDVVALGVEKPPALRRDARARPAVQEHSGLAVGVS